MQSFEQDLQDADKCEQHRILALVGDVTKQVVKQMTGLRLGKGMSGTEHRDAKDQMILRMLAGDFMRKAS